MKTVLVYNPPSGFFNDRLKGTTAEGYFRQLFVESGAADVHLVAFECGRLEELRTPLGYAVRTAAIPVLKLQQEFR